MANRKSLEAVSLAFANWRSDRGTPGARIPQGLRIQAIGLLQSYSKSQVIKALRINHVMLKRWQQRHTDMDKCEFVSLPAEPVLESSTSSLQVTLRNAQGGELNITGMTISQLSILAEHFTSLQGGA